MKTWTLALVLLRESLSSDKTPFAKLLRIANNSGSSIARPAPLPQVNRDADRPYHPHRKLNRDEISELVKLYRTGASMVDLAEKFECHRQTVARQLKKAGVKLREQQVRSSDFDQRARALYEQGNSLDEVADVLGVQASTINRAVRAAGGTLRPQRRRSRGE